MNNKLPTAEETLYTYHPIGRDHELSTDLWPDSTVISAMNEHTAAHTAALRERVKELEVENDRYRKDLEDISTGGYSSHEFMEKAKEALKQDNNET